MIYIPAKFILDTFPVQWNDVLWAYNHDYIDSQSIIDLAKLKSIAGEDSQLVRKLSVLDDSSKLIIRAIVERLSDQGASQDVSKRIWMLIILAYVFDTYEKPVPALQMVAEVYSSFNEPEEMSHFVYFMPASDGFDPTKYTVSQNRERLLRLWQEYLVNTKHELELQRSFERDNHRVPEAS